MHIVGLQSCSIRFKKKEKKYVTSVYTVQNNITWEINSVLDRRIDRPP